jgi:hypothetical protein
VKAEDSVLELAKKIYTVIETHTENVDLATDALAIARILVLATFVKRTTNPCQFFGNRPKCCNKRPFCLGKGHISS